MSAPTGDRVASHVFAKSPRSLPVGAACIACGSAADRRGCTEDLCVGSRCEGGKCACGNSGNLRLSDGDCCSGGCKLDPMLGGNCS
jgi:hypothetical protein